MTKSQINEMINLTLLNAPDILPYPIKEFYEYLKKLDDVGQIVTEYSDIGHLKYYAGYFKITDDDIDEVAKLNDSWDIPKNYTDGDIIFIDTVVTDGNKNILFKLIEKLKEKEPGAILGSWLHRKQKTLKIRLSKIKGAEINSL